MPASTGDHVSLARELAVSAARWALLVTTVVLIVLGLTLIGDWRG
jgi:hypothetical protein